jgi:parallel beta-helix repeat protein
VLMKIKTLALTLILALLISAIAGTQVVNLTSAQSSVTIIISADGISPVGAPIQRDGDIYTLTEDANGISVFRSNMTLDGNGHTLSRTLFVGYATNVTIRNFIIDLINSYDNNIHLESCSNVTIANNTITSSPEWGEQPHSLGIDVWGGTSNVITGNLIIGNVGGITLETATSNNRVFGNNITGNFRGLWIQGSQNNSIYSNNFDNNAVNVFIIGGTAGNPLMNTFDNGTTGNYWSNYNGTDNNSDGIGDSPYIIDANNKDNYPLMKLIANQNSSPPIPSPSPTPSPEPQPEPFPTLPVIAASVAAVIMGAGFLVYFKKRKQ